MRPIYLGLLIWLCAKPVYGQIPRALNTTLYDERNGINNGKVTAFLQGSDGYIWLGTTNGLLRYDSYTFKLYNDPSITNTITQLAEDQRHRIWMSFVGGGLSVFDPLTGAFKRHKLHDKANPVLERSEVTTLFFDKKDQLWLGIKQYGLIKADVDHGSVRQVDVVDKNDPRYTPEFRTIYNTVYKIYQDEDDLLWLATHDGLYQFSERSGVMKAVRKKDFSMEGKRKDLFGRILSDGDSLWLGSWSAGLSVYNRKTGAWWNYLPVPDQEKNGFYNLVTGVAAKSREEIWISTLDQGLGIFNKVTHQFFFFKNSPGYAELPKQDFLSMFQDKDANLWVIQNNGVLKISDPDYTFYFTDVPVRRTARDDFEVGDLLETENEVLIATSFADGLHITHKRTGVTQRLSVALAKNEEPEIEIRQLYQDSKKRIWVVSRDRIYRCDAAAGKLENIPQPEDYAPEKKSNSYNEMTEDKNGDFWIVTRRNGVFVYSERTGHYTHFTDRDSSHHIPSSRLYTTTTDRKGRVWMGGSYSFMGYADPETQKITELPTGFGDQEKLPGTQTFCLFADRAGDIWAGTFYGLCYFDCQGDTPRLKKIFRAGDGLRSDLVGNIQEDAYGNIWCITDAAVCMIDKKNYHIRAFNAKDGIVYGRNMTKLVNAPDKTMKLLINGGYYTFSPLMINKNEGPAPIQLVQMMVNNREYYYHQNLEENGKISLQPDQNFVAFEFAAINYTRPDKQQYEYMLEGIDEKWVTAGVARAASYTNLSGGNYIFRARSLRAGRGAMDAGISIPFFIDTPFYKTYIFYLLVLLMTSIILYRLYLNRIRHHREVHELRSKAQMLEKEKVLVMFEGLKQQLNPHFLFNSLTSLSGLIQTDKKMAGDFLDQMSRIYRYILQNRDSETVLLSDELKFVGNYIKLQKTRFKEGLVVHVDIDEEYYGCKVAPVTLQNLVENAIKHNIIDKESPLVIRIFCDDEYLVVQNNLQKKPVVETSNKQGLAQLRSLYTYLTSAPIVIEETMERYTIKIPLL
jgi:ligand-binding sensor domain-containing protein